MDQEPNLPGLDPTSQGIPVFTRKQQEMIFAISQGVVTEKQKAVYGAMDHRLYRQYQNNRNEYALQAARKFVAEIMGGESPLDDSGKEPALKISLPERRGIELIVEGASLDSAAAGAGMTVERLRAVYQKFRDGVNHSGAKAFEIYDRQALRDVLP